MTIYETYGALMFRRCRLLTRDFNLAEVAFESAFARLIEFGSSFRRVPSKLRWLYDQCDKESLRALSKYQEISTNSTPDESTDENTLAVAAFWADLSSGDQLIAIRKYVDGFSAEKIAELTGLSVRSIGYAERRMSDKADMIMEALDHG